MLVACRLAGLSALGAQLCVRQKGNAGSSTAPRIRTTQAPATLRHRLTGPLGPWFVRDRETALTLRILGR
jgi:hypothetical protein